MIPTSILGMHESLGVERFDILGHTFETRWYREKKICPLMAHSHQGLAAIMDYTHEITLKWTRERGNMTC